MIRLFILEDHPIIVDGLKQRFRHHRDNITVAGWSNNPEEFTKTVSEESFDILILDLWFPDRDPLDIFCLIRKRFPEKPVIIYTSERSTFWMKTMMEKGVKAYLMKDIDIREFKSVIEKVNQGKTVFPGLLFEKLPAFKNDELPFRKYILTPSERSLVWQLSRGVLLKNIADKRYTTVSTIEKSLKKIRKKVNVKTNPELIRILMEHKLI
jgi:DNA-binding NarL/FixJ family response regulator